MTDATRMPTRHDRRTLALDELVDEQAHRVRGSIFIDPAIYDLEVEQIFHRCWLFLGHVSELPAPGDYVTRRMGTDHVIVQRDAGGTIRALVNACLHRGAQLCRADAGNTRRIVCPYHGWTYDATGKLLTTTFDRCYHREDLSPLRLASAPQLDTYAGLIFATWDPAAPPLAEYLGDVRWYLDLLFQRTPGGMEVLGPPQRWIVETNWKLPALNFGTDMQHALHVHRGPWQIGAKAGAPVPMSALMQGLQMSPQVSFPGGHGCSLISAPPGVPEFCGFPAELVPVYERTLGPAQLGVLRTLFSTVGTIFPHVSWIQPAIAVTAGSPPVAFLTLRIWQPLGPDKIELWSWYFAEKEAPAAWKQEVLRTGIQTFGMAGLYEEDDTEVWASITRASGGAIARTALMDFRAGLDMAPFEGFPGPGTVYPSLADRAQFNFLCAWKRHLGRGA